MTETTALAVQSAQLMPAMSLAEAADRFNAVALFTQKIMRSGIDYGVVPGTDKPTLLKPGAEKLTTFFGLSVRFELIEKIEDWTGREHDGEPLFYYWFRCQMKRGDLPIAEADGSCNSWEAKYRFRWAERKCPTCSNTTIIKGKAEYGGGWLCWSKRGGCGAKFQDGDPAIEKQELGRVANPNPADVVNTVKKMAQKRALVAATLLAVNASEYYTQDMEDLPIVEIVDITPDLDPEPAPAAKRQPPPQRRSQPQPEPEPEQQSNGKTNGRKLATIRTGQWAGASVELAEGEPYYQKKDGSPDGFHMVGAAAKLGYHEITDANLADVLAELRAYATDQQKLQEELPL